MTLITSNKELKRFIHSCEGEPYITVDTEFVRARTYYAQLCLVQIATKSEAVAIDTLAKDIDLDLLKPLFANEKILKVFHAGRQDLEIFHTIFNAIPTPLFDTQIAASVCGYGEQTGYETLVREIVNVQIDKSSQFTDWSRRPLSDKQLSYALDDVIYLRDIYEQLNARLKSEEREAWVFEEIEKLYEPTLYAPDPMTMWTRVKTRNAKPHQLAIVQALAAWREDRARATDRPRGHIMKDESILEIAMAKPQSINDLDKLRMLPKVFMEPDRAKKMLRLIDNAINLPKEQWPKKETSRPLSSEEQNALEMLRLILKISCNENSVVPAIVANKQDMDDLARGNMDGPVMQGWRHNIFGHRAKALLEGRLSLGFKDGTIIIEEK